MALHISYLSRVFSSKVSLVVTLNNPNTTALVAVDLQYWYTLKARIKIFGDWFANYLAVETASWDYFIMVKNYAVLIRLTGTLITWLSFLLQINVGNQNHGVWEHIALDNTLLLQHSKWVLHGGNTNE